MEPEQFHPDEGCPGCGGELFPVKWSADTNGDWNIEECLKCGAGVIWHFRWHKDYIPLGPWIYGDQNEEDQLRTFHGHRV